MYLSELDKTKYNRLIWGDNLLAMQALLAQGYAGKIDLIYIDPPFASSADYSFQVTIEGKQVEKQASVIERLAYTDTWEEGMDSYLDWFYPKLQLMKRLLNENGSFYIHLDRHVSHYLKVVLDEVFGQENFVNEIVWKRANAHNDPEKYGVIHDTIFYYSKNKHKTWNQPKIPLIEAKLETDAHYVWEPSRGIYFRLGDLKAPGNRGPKYTYKGIVRHWKWSIEKLKAADEAGELYYTKNGIPFYKIWIENPEMSIQDIWMDIPQIKSGNEKVDYPTQKPEALLERIIQASSNEGDLVADFFCGSGTTMAVAERLNRGWIGCNLDKVGIQVSRNRLVNQGARPFLLENIGNYQRHMIYLSGSKINEMQRIILKLYGAEPRSDRADLGVRAVVGEDAELVYVGYPDRPVTAKKVIELAQEADILDGTGYKKLVVLAWDYDYNFSTELENRKIGLRERLRTNINPLTIPPEIYNYLKKAKDEEELDGLREKIIFHEKPYLKITKPEVIDVGDGKINISLKIDRYVLMNFPIPEKQQIELRKVIKDNFAALIDYWAIDWDYDGKTFRSTWQAIRGNGKKTSTVVISALSPELLAGKRTIAVRLVDVFGNDASVIAEVK